jgi:hypothetical protein
MLRFRTSYKIVVIVATALVWGGAFAKDNPILHKQSASSAAKQASCSVASTRAAGDREPACCGQCTVAGSGERGCKVVVNGQTTCSPCSQ